MSSRVCRSDGTAVVWHEKSCGSVRMHGEGVTALVHGSTVQFRAHAREAELAAIIRGNAARYRAYTERRCRLFAAHTAEYTTYPRGILFAGCTAGCDEYCHSPTARQRQGSFGTATWTGQPGLGPSIDA